MSPESQAVHELLQKGIAAAKGGQQAEAKALLTQVLRQDARNVQALIWLAGITHDPVEQEKCLQRVLSIDPHNVTAQQGLTKIAPRVTQQLLKQGIAAVQSGDLAKGRDLLLQVTDRDEKQASAWLWLSQVVEDQEEQIVCLENVLALEPGNIEAQTRLLRLSSPLADTPSDAVVSDDALFDAASFDALVFGDPAPADSSQDFSPDLAPSEDVYEPPAYDYGSAALTEEPAIESSASAMFGGYEIVEDQHSSSEPVAWDRVWSKYKDPYSCTYCAAPAEESRKSCPACGRSLISTTRSREKRSLALWVFIAIELLGSLLLTAVMLWFFTDFSGLLERLPVGIVAPDMLALFEQQVQVFRITLVILTLVSYAGVFALYMRWAPIWYWYLITTLLNLGVALLQIILNIIASGPLFLIALFGSLFSLGILAVIYGPILWLIFASQDDFLKMRERILLGADDGLASGEDYLDQGMIYAHQGMWAMAAVHFHHAISILGDDPEPYRVAAIAGVKLRDATLARYALDQFKERAPDNPRLPELTKMVAAIK